MSRRISAAEVLDTVKVDLWDNEYELREITRSVGKRLRDAQVKAQKLSEDSDGDSVAKALIEAVDILLKGADGTPDASAVLTPLWKDDKLGLDWLTAFAEALQEEATSRRPTSAPKSES